MARGKRITLSIAAGLAPFAVGAALDMLILKHPDAIVVIAMLCLIAGVGSLGWMLASFTYQSLGDD